MSKSKLTSCAEEDFLENDPELRGQNFVCLSFISPEDVIKRKESYFFETFIKHFSKDMQEFFEKLSEKYPDEEDIIRSIKDRHPYIFDTNLINEEYSTYYNLHSNELEKAYFEENDFQTTIRGIKIRGVFETRREADIRCKVLERKENAKFHIYVASVGCWCPWSPNPDDVEDSEYAETQLNTLVKNYKINQKERDDFYEKRKQELKDLKKKEQVEVVDTSDEVVSESLPISNNESSPVDETQQSTEPSELLDQIETDDTWNSSHKSIPNTYSNV